ncbi:MAG: glycosyltransferase, partial [Thermobifida fusca]|nr:glycosyltransferase [Thermobifida fusca]
RSGRPRAPRGERPRILTLGQLRPRKGVETAIRALPAVPDAELVVVGGPEASAVRTDPEAVRLHRLARRLGVADRVCFLGRVPHGEVPALLRSADVVVNVPWDEPCGMSTVEAMACGIPVVASDAGSHRDTVVHEITGVLVPPRDPRALGVRLRSLLHDVVAAESYGIAGADRAAARFSWETVAREVDACCAAALDAAGRSPCLATEALP